MIDIPYNSRITFFSPHPDDETFSSGALLYKLGWQNRVKCIFLTSGANGVEGNYSLEKKIKIREKEAKAACSIFSIWSEFLNWDKDKIKSDSTYKNYLTKIINNTDFVFMPHPNEAHQTHKAANNLIEKILQNSNISQCWQYEVWTPLEKPNNIYFFGEEEMKIKKKAMKQYKSQIERTNYIDAIVGLNTYRGVMGKEMFGGFGTYSKDKVYGEAFYVRR